MAMLVGGIAWGTVAFILVMTNPRVLKENAEQTLARSGQILRFIVGFVVDQVPIINVIPTLFPILWWMYRTQIKKEKAALAEYNKKKAALEAQERQEKIVQFAQYRAAQAEAEQEEILDAERGDEESTEELLQAA
jgi:CRISPR/Cas system-associated protein Cas10 (large subunit of type III CRISPR-Cas system)